MLELELYSHLLKQLSFSVFLAPSPFVSEILARREGITKWETIEHLALCDIVAHSLAGEILRIVILARVSIFVRHVQGLDLVSSESLRGLVILIHIILIIINYDLLRE